MGRHAAPGAPDDVPSGPVPAGEPGPRSELARPAPPAGRPPAVGAPTPRTSWRAALAMGLATGLATAGVLHWVGADRWQVATAAVVLPLVVMGAVWLAHRLPDHR